MSKNSDTFSAKVKDVVRKIPKGKVLTYGQVAKKAGSEKAYRAVASIMSKNYAPDVPCHRVVRADGGLAGYNRGGIEEKAKILSREGVKLQGFKVVL
jgi:O-6-methylguanine DNA methyltransferase